MIKQELSNAIRFLSLDAVEKAKSGHPGAPMGMADIAYILWKKFLKHNPSNPKWLNRDRFVLSNGHGSMLLYSLLHLKGYKVSINDIKTHIKPSKNYVFHHFGAWKYVNLDTFGPKREHFYTRGCAYKKQH